MSNLVVYIVIATNRTNYEHTAKLFVQLRKFAELKHLPMLLAKGMEDLYQLMREWITGGLSNVLNRFNIGNLNFIKKFFYNLNKKVSIIEGKVITHNIYLDANSLYPSSFSSVKLPWNRYTGRIMYMAGPLKNMGVFFNLRKKVSWRLIF
jgi:hypothetical protein